MAEHITQLARQLQDLQERTVPEDIEFLFLDGVILSLCALSRKILLLCAYGIGPGGRKEILGFKESLAESYAFWCDFLGDLKSRGLRGQGLKLIITDGSPALLKAAGLNFPAIRRQRCLVNKWKNIAAKLNRTQKEPCLRELNSMFKAECPEEFLRAFRQWKANWSTGAPAAVRCLERDLGEVMAYFDFDPALWPQLRSTRTLERAVLPVGQDFKLIQLFSNKPDLRQLPAWAARRLYLALNQAEEPAQIKA